MIQHLPLAEIKAYDPSFKGILLDCLFFPRVDDCSKGISIYCMNICRFLYLAQNDFSKYFSCFYVFIYCKMHFNWVKALNISVSENISLQL